MSSTRITHPTKVTVPGVFGLVAMLVSDVLYVQATPCSLELSTDSQYTLWAYEGCSFSMQTGGFVVSMAGMLVGFVLGWLVA